MLPPYSSDEVAQAVQQRLLRGGAPALQLTVRAELPNRAWFIAARLDTGRELSARYPFADPAGIHTPAELADWFAQLVDLPPT